MRSAVRSSRPVPHCLSEQYFSGRVEQACVRQELDVLWADGLSAEAAAKLGIEHCAPEVVLDGVIEQHGVLRDDGHLPPQTRLCDVGYWDAIDLDHA